jgi:hypothetical protein
MSANLEAALIAQNSYPGSSVRISICEKVSTQLIYIPLIPAFSLKGEGADPTAQISLQSGETQ